MNYKQKPIVYPPIFEMWWQSIDNRGWQKTTAFAGWNAALKNAEAVDTSHNTAMREIALIIGELSASVSSVIGLDNHNENIKRINAVLAQLPQ